MTREDKIRWDGIESDKIELDDVLLILPSPNKGIGSMAKMVSRRPFVGWWEYFLNKELKVIASDVKKHYSDYHKKNTDQQGSLVPEKRK